jgi:hypothetical protein
MTREASDSDRTRTWILDHVPHTHSYADVKGLCDEQGLKEVVFNGQDYSAKVDGSSMHRRWWRFRATADADVTNFSVAQQVAGDTVSIVGYLEGAAAKTVRTSIVRQSTRINYWEEKKKEQGHVPTVVVEDDDASTAHPAEEAPEWKCKTCSHIYDPKKDAGGTYHGRRPQRETVHRDWQRLEVPRMRRNQELGGRRPVPTQRDDGQRAGAD